MIVSCPNCATRYVLDAAVLRPPGRHVRCARCQTTWFQEPALDLGADSMIQETAREPVSDKSRMLPAPPRIGAQAERDAADAGGYRDRGRDLTRDLDRDLPRETGRDGFRDPLRDPPQRDVVREALGQDTGYGQPVTREISRESMRDMGRDIGRAVGRDLDRRDPGLERGRFEPAPTVRGGDIDFEDGMRTEPNIPRARSADERRNETRKKSGGSSGLLIGGGMFLALMAGTAYVADAFHEQIVQIFPGTRGVYSMLGYSTSTRELDFANIVWGKEIENGVTVLAIRGQIVNVTDREVAVPKLRVTVNDSEKQKLYQWTTQPEQSKVAAKSKIPLLIRLESPPPEAWSLDIRFAKAGE
jgi:predicted Zn finger-like uncharacterized protein